MGISTPDINVDISLLNGATNLPVNIVSLQPELINPSPFALLIDRGVNYSEAHESVTASASGNDVCSNAMANAELQVSGEVELPIQPITDVSTFVHIVDGSLTDVGFTYVWSESIEYMVGYENQDPDFRLKRYAVDGLGNIKMLLDVTYNMMENPSCLIGYVEYSVIEGSTVYSITSRYWNACTETNNTGPGSTATRCTLLEKMLEVEIELRALMQSVSNTIEGPAPTVVFGQVNHLISNVTFTDGGCNIEKQGINVPENDAGLININITCTKEINTITVTYDNIGEDGLVLFNPSEIRLQEFSSLSPTVESNYVEFLVSDADLVKLVEVNAIINSFPQNCPLPPENSHVSELVELGIIKDLQFEKCGVSFKYQFTSFSETAEITIQTPERVRLIVPENVKNYSQFNNTTKIMVSKKAGDLRFNFEMLEGEPLKTTDQVIVSINMPGCNSSQSASYNVAGCTCQTEDPNPKLKCAPSQNSSTNTNPPADHSTSGGGNEPILDVNKPVEEINQDAYGRTTSVEYKNGGTLSYVYDDINKTITETTEDGTNIRYHYDPTFIIVQKKEVLGGQKGFNYEYNQNGSVTRIATLQSNVEVYAKTFEYNANNQLTKKIENDGTFETWAFTLNTTTHTDKFGNVTIRTFDESKRIISVSNARGTVLNNYGLVSLKDYVYIEHLQEPYAEFNGVYGRNGANYYKWSNDTSYYIDQDGIGYTGYAPIFTFVSRPDPLELYEEAVYQVGSVTLNTKHPKVERLLSITTYNPENQIQKYEKKKYDFKAFLINTEYRLTSNLSEVPYYKENYDSNGDTVSTQFLREGVVQTIAEPVTTYNQLGRVETITAQDGGVTTYQYSTVPGQEDLVTIETDPYENKTYHEYDSMRREIKTYGNTTRPGVKTYTNGGYILTFECKQYDPLTQTFGPTHYKETYTYMGTLLLSKRTENATNTQFIIESWTYDFLGRRSTHTDANGVVTKYFYNSMDNITQEIRDYGASPNNLNITTNYTYNSLGLLETTSTEGRTTKTVYDSFGRVTSVIQDPTPGLNITQVSYTYDSQGRQQTMTDAMGNVTTYVYNQLGQQTQTINALGVINETVFDGAGNVIRQIQDKGVGKKNVTTEFFFDNMGRQNRTLSAVGEAYQREDRVEFDLNGNTIKQIEDYGIGKLNRTTVFEFDQYGNQIKTILDPDAPSYTGLKITNESTYNEIGQLTSTIAPNGLVTQYNYNYLGRQTSTVVDPAGAAITSSVIYDNNGNTTQTTDAGGLVITTVYDALSRQGTQTVDPGGKNIVTKVFYNRDGSVDKTINPEGVVTKNIYNSIGQRTSTIVDQGVTNITTQYEYNLVGNITTIIDPLTKTATRGYDALHRTIASTDAKGNISRVVYDNLNMPVESMDALGVKTVTVYDLLGRTTSQTVDPTGLNQTTSFEFDALNRTTKVIKANSIQNVFEYDLADRKTKTIEDPTGLNIITQYEFNSLSQMTKVIDAKNKATQYSYNSLGQLTTETYADAGVKSYTYNSIGQRITQTDQNNNQFGYLYDNLYRLTTVNITPGSGVGGTTQQVFTYDNLSRLTNAKDITSTYTNEVQRTYNTLGRLTTETQKIGTSTDRTVTKDYNLIGRVTQLTYPNGRVNSYTFDNNHLPNTIVSNNTTVATYTFNSVNAPETKTLGNNVSLNFEYNNRYQITKHDWKKNGVTIAGYNYGHDNVGNRIWSENLVTANKSEHFVFDNADRLTAFKTGALNGTKTDIVSPTYSQSWNLDSIGNWAGFTDNGTNSTNTFSNTHEMTQFKGVTQIFDNNGNLISDGVRNFKYDAFNRIIEVKIGTVILAEYQYDAFNRRVMKKVDADLNSSFETTIKFLYDGFRCIEELNASDALIKEYVYGSLYIDEVILQRTGSTDYYFTHDYRYSVTSLTNSAGSIVESYDYKVYGERTITGSGLTGIGYTGQRHDSETGLMYFKNRYFSTSTGSFVTRDPLGYIDGLSMYLGYFGGMGVDPEGLALVPTGYFWSNTNLRTIANLYKKIIKRLTFLSTEYLKEYRSLPKDKCFDKYRLILLELIAKNSKVIDYMDKNDITVYRDVDLPRGVVARANSITGSITINTNQWSPDNFFNRTIDLESQIGTEPTSEDALYHEITHLALKSWDNPPTINPKTWANVTHYIGNTSEFSNAYVLQGIYEFGLGHPDILVYKVEAKQCLRKCNFFELPWSPIFNF